MRARYRIRAAGVAARDDTRNMAVLSGSGPVGAPGMPPGDVCVSPRWHLWVDSLPPKGAIGWKRGGGDVAVARSSRVVRGQRWGRGCVFLRGVLFPGVP